MSFSTYYVVLLLLFFKHRGGCVEQTFLSAYVMFRPPALVATTQISYYHFASNVWFFCLFIMRKYNVKLSENQRGVQVKGTRYLRSDEWVYEKRLQPFFYKMHMVGKIF